MWTSTQAMREQLFDSETHESWQGIELLNTIKEQTYSIVATLNTLILI